MIIIFHVTDPDGVERRLSAICAPSTTAAGAIHLFRTRLGVPNSVKVEVQLENSIPIRHQTAPLTSLRKQRSGVAHVMQILLWVTLTGAAESMAEINFSKLEVAQEGEEGGASPRDGSHGHDEDTLDEMGPSWTARGERRAAHPPLTSVAGSQPQRILKEQSPSATGRTGNPASQADETASPLTARRPAPAVSVRISRPAPLTARGLRLGTAAGLPPPPTTATAAASLPASRKASLSTAARAAEDGSVRSPTAAERVTKSKPQTAAVAVAARDDSGARAPGATTVATAAPSSAESPAALDNTRSLNASPAATRTTDADSSEPVAHIPPQLADRGHTVRRDCALAQIMIREYPKLVDPSESKQIVAVVKEDDRLRGMSYDPELLVPSAMECLSDAEYSRYLSAGLVHGVEVRSTAHGDRIALYGALSSLRHSCRPNATVHFDFRTEPNSASCRCAVKEGLKKGDEITCLYRHADSQAFLLLSRERRQSILKKRYYFDCACARCQAPLMVRAQRRVDVTKRQKDEGKAAAPMAADDGVAVEPLACSPALPPAARDAEATLTGCFFTDSSYDTDAEKQAAISTEMKKDFDALQLMSDDGLDIVLTIPGNVPPTTRTKQLNRLLQFLRRYASAESVLRLHEHHWRVSLVRAAYIQETVRLCAMKGVTPEARRRDPDSTTLFTPTRTVYDLCFKQLAVESLFIPAGNPHRLTTYESFQYLVSILPPNLAEAIMRQARATSRVDWKDLQETKQAWGLLKRTNVSPVVTARTGAAAAAAMRGRPHRSSDPQPHPQPHVTPTPPAAARAVPSRQPAVVMKSETTSSAPRTPVVKTAAKRK